MDLVQGEDEEFVSVLLGISGHVGGGAPGGVEEGGRTVGDCAVGVYLRSLRFRCPQQYIQNSVRTSANSRSISQHIQSVNLQSFSLCLSLRK